MPPAPRSPSSAARVVYAGIIASTLIISAGSLTVALALGTGTAAAGWPDGVALVLGSAAFVTSIRQWKTLHRPANADQAEQWWTDNTGRVLIVWGLLEFTAVAGAVVVFATGHLTAFVALAVMALAGLLTLSPGRVPG